MTIDKRLLGDQANSGPQIVVQSAWIPGEGSANATSFIIKQLGVNRFIMKNKATGNSGIVTLQAAAVTAAGQARISVTPFGGSTEYLKSLQYRKAITFSGNIYVYNLQEIADEAGEAVIDFS